MTARVVMVVNRGRIVLKEEVDTTEVPESVYKVLAESI